MKNGSRVQTGSYFIYHAQASALGGVFRKPWSGPIESQAATSLPITGGKGTNSKTNFNYNDAITFDSASSEVNGYYDDAAGSYRTELSTTVQGLKVGGVLSVDTVTAKLVTIHTGDDTETIVDPTGCFISDLRFSSPTLNDTVKVELGLDTFTTLNTSAKFKQKYKTDQTFKKDIRKQFLWDQLPNNAPEFLRTRYKWQGNPNLDPESQGIMPCTLVKSITTSQLEVWGNVIIVPNFGVIYLGELLMENGCRRLSMMRMMLGSPMEGDVTVGGVEGNGTKYP